MRDIGGLAETIITCSYYIVNFVTIKFLFASLMDKVFQFRKSKFRDPQNGNFVRLGNKSQLKDKRKNNIFIKKLDFSEYIQSKKKLKEINL